MWTAMFWKSLAERAISASAFAAAGTMQAAVFNWFDADWKAVAGVALTAGTLSALKSLGANAAKTGGASGPSLIGSEVLADDVEVVDTEGIAA